jgi:hypothetical protein
MRIQQSGSQRRNTSEYVAKLDTSVFPTEYKALVLVSVSRPLKTVHSRHSNDYL